MNIGKTLFAQVMEYVPWKTFGRIMRPAWRRCGGADAELCRSVSCDGVRAIDVARIAARYRGLPDVESIQVVSHGTRWRAGQSTEIKNQPL